MYDGLNPVQELSSTPTANLLTGGIDEYFTRTDSTGTANFLTDALGRTIALTDNTGNPLAQYTYEPFGNTRTTGVSTNSYQFTGRENDGNGVYFLRARYYNPTLERFIFEDPLRFSGSGPNLYAYARNNPSMFIDPTGQSLSYVHFEETFIAAMSVYGDPLEAYALAMGSMISDLDQGGSWRDARMHAMAGRKGDDPKNGQPQTCQQAYDSTSNLIAEDAAAHSFPGEVEAIHDIQDSYASGHQYQFWPGGFPSLAHIAGDLDYLPEAVSATENYLRTNGSLSPSNYLYPDPCS